MCGVIQQSYHPSILAITKQMEHNCRNEYTHPLEINHMYIGEIGELRVPPFPPLRTQQ